MVRHSRSCLTLCTHLHPFDETRPIDATCSSGTQMTREIESFALADGKDRGGACVAVAYETELKVYQVPILFVHPIS